MGNINMVMVNEMLVAGKYEMGSSDCRRLRGRKSYREAKGTKPAYNGSLVDGLRIITVPTDMRGPMQHQSFTGAATMSCWL